MKKISTAFIALTLVFSLKAQLYSVAAPFKSIVKTTSHGVLHEYIEITNLSGSNLPMRWVAQFGGSSETPSPSAWTYSVSDPDSTYTTLNDQDSADFILPVTNNNKIIISVFHNGSPGSYAINFKIFPQANRNDSAIIGFPIIVSQVVGINNHANELKNNIYPNPSSGIFRIEQKFKRGVLYNLTGEVVQEINTNEINLIKHPNGCYFLHLENMDGTSSKSRLIKQ